MWSLLNQSKLLGPRELNNDCQTHAVMSYTMICCVDRNPPSCRRHAVQGVSTWCAAGRTPPDPLCSVHDWKNQKRELFSSASEVRGGFASGCVPFSWNGRCVINTNPLSLLLMLRIFGSAPSLTMALTFCLSLWLRLVRMWHREAVTSLGRSVPVSSLGSIATTSGNTCFTSGQQNKRQNRKCEQLCGRIRNKLTG